MRNPRFLDRAFAHRPCDHRAFEQVGAELREDPPLGRLVEAVTGAADPLEAACDRLGRLDLDDEVDGTHVDPELERRGRDEARDLPPLEQLLDLDALLSRERAVMCACDLALRQVVEA